MQRNGQCELRFCRDQQAMLTALADKPAKSHYQSGHSTRVAAPRGSPCHCPTCQQRPSTTDSFHTAGASDWPPLESLCPSFLCRYVHPRLPEGLPFCKDPPESYDMRQWARALGILVFPNPYQPNGTQAVSWGCQPPGGASPLQGEPGTRDPGTGSLWNTGSSCSSLGPGRGTTSLCI